MNDGPSRLVEACLHVSAGFPAKPPFSLIHTFAERRAARPF